MNSDTEPTLEPNRILAACGYLLVGFSIVCFGAIVYLQIYDSWHPVGEFKSTLDFVRHESPTIILLVIGYITVSMGRRLISSVQITETRTIPVEDIPLIRDAVMKGNSEPIDQYLRLRSLSGFAGNFTKLQVTGLPLTTVFLTLVFAGVALLPLTTKELATQFLDLAKLTLGAFIGSFVQGRVEQRKQQQAETKGKMSSELPPA